MTHNFRRIFQNSKFKIAAIISAITLTVTVLAPALPAHAAQITSRKLTLGSSASNTATSYSFSFTLSSATVVKSLDVKLCTTASGTCTPSGQTNTAATLASQPTGLGAASGWTATVSTNGRLQIANSGNATAPSGAVTLTFNNVTNPNNVNTTFYGWITTYSDAAWTPGNAIDSGVVTASTANQMTVTASVPETLTFCTGTSGITSTSCSGATGTSVALGTLGTTTTGAQTSQMGATTNAGSGYIITVNGTTLTSGPNTITAMNPATTSTQGTSQFGINLMSNTTPSIGSATAGAGSAAPAAGYNTANTFKFLTGDTVASVGAADDFRLFTVSYIANISNVTPPGTYQTAITYICTATY
jgi:hypothetical protein